MHDVQEIRRRLEEAIEIEDSASFAAYLNIKSRGDELLSICAFETKAEAEAQRVLLIESIVEVLTD